MREQAQNISYSLCFNFDDALVNGIISLNEKYGGNARIDEVFGALANCPISSARPTSRIPHVTWLKFARRVNKMLASNIKFNFLMNTSQDLKALSINGIRSYLSRLADIGVTRLTLGTPELCHLIKSLFPQFHVTISLTYGISSENKLNLAEESGASAAYLDGVFVNRNFELLRKLLRKSNIECRLYANISCIAACPVIRSHYKMFAGKQDSYTVHQNDAFFAGCTLIKLNNPVEWIQMPWIRPEDIPTYMIEGIIHFKLADRLAPTETLLTIAESYLKGVSPGNLFVLIERDGLKYKMFPNNNGLHKSTPIMVLNDQIPSSFIDHFRNGECKSNDISCMVCSKVARRAVHISDSINTTVIPKQLKPLIPLELWQRSKH